MRRHELPTPVLIIDIEALERNIGKMAAWAAGRNVQLRPHAKTHKSGEIARRQIEAGAVGICCAKIGEAEALAAEEIQDILITSPVVAEGAVRRLAQLSGKVQRLAVVVDHPANVSRLAGALNGCPLDVLVDIDTGSHRTGATSPAAAVALARQIASTETLRYRGVQFYCGTLQHIARAEDRRAALTERTEYLAEVVNALRAAGLEPEIVSGAGTGSFAIDADLGMLNELQPGSYVFMDRQYGECEQAGPSFEPSLFIDTRVVSANTPGQVTLDAGLKSMSTEAGPPLVLAGADPSSSYRFMGDEHGLLLTPGGGSDPPLDGLVTLMPPHCDPTVNLYDHYAVCKGEAVIAWWPVSARGRSG